LPVFEAVFLSENRKKHFSTPTCGKLQTIGKCVKKKTITRGNRQKITTPILGQKNPHRTFQQPCVENFLKLFRLSEKIPK